MSPDRYSTAYITFCEQQTKAVQRLDRAAAGWQSPYDFNACIRSDDGIMVHVTFDSIFKEGAGPEPDMTCARWDLDYRCADGKIAAAKVHGGGGAGYSRC